MASFFPPGSFTAQMAAEMAAKWAEDAQKAIPWPVFCCGPGVSPALWQLLASEVEQPGGRGCSPTGPRRDLHRVTAEFALPTVENKYVHLICIGAVPSASIPEHWTVMLLSEEETQALIRRGAYGLRQKSSRDDLVGDVGRRW